MNTTEIAKLVIAKMLPTPNQRGIDLDEPYFDQLCREAAEEHSVDESDVDMEVRQLLNEVSKFGFSVLG